MRRRGTWEAGVQSSLERGFREWDPEDEGYDNLGILPHLPAEQRREHQTAERLRGQAALTWSEQMGWGRCPGRMNLRFSGPERERGYHTLDQIEQILPGEPGYTEWSEWPDEIQNDPLELHEFFQPPEEEEDSDEGLEADDGSPVQPTQRAQQIQKHFEESETKKRKEEERVWRAIEADRQAREEGQSTSRDPPGRFWKPAKSTKRTYAERDSEGNSSSKLTLKKPNTAPPPSLVNRPPPVQNLSALLPPASSSSEDESLPPERAANSVRSAHESDPTVYPSRPRNIPDQNRETVPKHYSPIDDGTQPAAIPSGSAFTSLAANLPPVPHSNSHSTWDLGQLVSRQLIFSTD